MLSLCKYESRESRVTFGDLGMKHLDVVDGELAAVSSGRTASCRHHWTKS